jgi:hypothetical protein
MIGGLALVAAMAMTMAMAAGPAFAAVASAAASIPEPADFTLFLLGVAGLLIGRRSSRSRTRAE